MNEVKLDKLIDQYVQFLRKNDEIVIFKEREERKKFYQSFNYDRILSMSNEEMNSYLKKLWNVIPISVNKICNKNKDFKRSLADLLYGDRELENRYNEFYDNVVEFKASAMSEVLTYNYPNDCIIWNNKVKNVFMMLEIKDIPKESDNLTFNWYQKLISYGKIIQKRLNEKMNRNFNLFDVDYFYDVIFLNYSIDVKKLDKIIGLYKNNASEYIPNEIYKWEAIAHFQNTWDINAKNFLEMMKNAFSKVNNLLSGMNYFPKKMIESFCEKESETVREMFKVLYDESKSLNERYSYFILTSKKLLNKYWNNDMNHYQDLHAVSVYLSFKFPNKYYVYKASIDKKATAFLGVNITCIDSEVSKEERDIITLQNYYRVCDNVVDYISSDKELLELQQNYLSNNSYRNDDNHILAWNLLYYYGSIYSKKKYWIMEPNVANSNYWEEFKEQNMIQIGWPLLGNLSELTNKQEISDSLNQYYPKEGSRKNDILAIYQFVHEMSIGDIVIIKNGKYNLYGYGEIKSDYSFIDNKHIRKVEWKKIGNYNALSVAPKGGFAIKTLTDITDYDNGTWAKEIIEFMNREIVEVEEEKEYINFENKNYYWLNASPKIWSFSDIKVGETIEYTSLNDNGNKRRIYQNFVDAQKGDIVIAYESHPVKAIVGLCEVKEKLENNIIIFKKIEYFANPIKYEDIIDILELKEMEFLKNQHGTLFKVTKDEFNVLIEIIRELNPIVKKSYHPYTVDNFLSEVYIDITKYNEMKNLLERKKNIILQGAPGVGKTFMAKRFAYSLMVEENDDRIKFIQFHQSYSYEDFIEGIKPNENGKFTLERGIFYDFCKEAEEHYPKPYYLIIDEINRGNLSKIFGELLMLIENDKRGENLTLAYSKVPFHVPKNLYIIGMMNTADRSLALIDYALRRRFSFVDIEPAFKNETFQEYQKRLNSNYFDSIIKKIADLNDVISKDSSLGAGFVIGHSYFCNLKEANKEELKSIIKYEIIPMLKEYWIDDEATFKDWEKKLLEA